jgi:hypothetical protein
LIGIFQRINEVEFLIEKLLTQIGREKKEVFERAYILVLLFLNFNPSLAS